MDSRAVQQRPWLSACTARAAASASRPRLQAEAAVPVLPAHQRRRAPGRPDVPHPRRDVADPRPIRSRARAVRRRGTQRQRVVQRELAGLHDDRYRRPRRHRQACRLAARPHHRRVLAVGVRELAVPVRARQDGDAAALLMARRQRDPGGDMPMRRQAAVARSRAADGASRTLPMSRPPAAARCKPCPAPQHAGHVTRTGTGRRSIPCPDPGHARRILSRDSTDQSTKQITATRHWASLLPVCSMPPLPGIPGRKDSPMQLATAAAGSPARSGSQRAAGAAMGRPA